MAYEYNHIGEEMQERLNKTFKLLKTRYKFNFARQDFYCCMSCGTNAISIESDKRVEKKRPAITKWAFYHHQDAARIPDGYLHIAYGDTEAEGEAIREAALDSGLCVIWSGTIARRVELVHPDALEGRLERLRAEVQRLENKLDDDSDPTAPRHLREKWLVWARTELASVLVPEEYATQFIK